MTSQTDNSELGNVCLSIVECRAVKPEKVQFWGRMKSIFLNGRLAFSEEIIFKNALAFTLIEVL